MNTVFNIPSTLSVFLRVNDHKEIVPLTQIVRLQSERNYTRLYLVDGRQLIMAKTLGLFEKSLSPFFLRIHRSHIVNFDYIRYWITSSHKWCLILENGDEIEIAQRRQKYLVEIIGKVKEK